MDTIFPNAACQAQVMTHDTGDLPRILSRREVATILGVSVVTVWRMVRRGRFPKPFRVSAGRVGWSASTVRLWIERKTEETAGERM